MHAVRLDVKTAGVADGAAVRSSSPEWSGCDATVGTPHARVVSRRRRNDTIMIVRLTRNLLRAVGARVGVWMRTSAVCVVRGLDGTRSTRMAVAVVATARIVFVTWPRSGCDGARMVVGIVLGLDAVVSARMLVTVGWVIVAHGGRTAVVKSWARFAEGVAHVQT